jgi:hypothetical protein
MPSFPLKNNTVPPICSVQPYCEQVLFGWTHIAIFYHNVSDYLLNRLVGIVNSYTN